MLKLNLHKLQKNTLGLFMESAKLKCVASKIDLWPRLNDVLWSYLFVVWAVEWWYIQIEALIGNAMRSFVIVVLPRNTEMSYWLRGLSISG